MAAIGLNPFAIGTVRPLSDLLRNLCSLGLDDQETAELDDEIEALVPALVELRDRGHLKLNMAVVVDHATFAGFSRLAQDERLSALSRARCVAMRNRKLVIAVKAHLGHI